MKIIGLLALLSFALSGCATKTTKQFARIDLFSACAEIFLGNEYQASASTHPFLNYTYFAVSRNYNRDIVTCAYRSYGALISTKLATQTDSLKACEQVRLGYMREKQIPLEKCEIYAEGNKIISKDFENYTEGTYTSVRPIKYLIEDNKRTNMGTWTSASGDKYVGEFKNDLRNGNGTYTFASGEEYVGEWKDDKKIGKGTLTYADGAKYVGEFKDDKFNKGTWTSASGDKYVGEFKNDLRNGNGTYTFASGEEYVGEWKDGKRNGNGTNTFADGTVKSGIWADGKYLDDLAEHQKREEKRLILLSQKEKQKQKGDTQIVAQKQPSNEWTRLVGSADGSMWYVDIESISRYDGYTHYWALLDFAEPSENGDLSQKFYDQADCILLENRTLLFSLHKQQMGGGNTTTYQHTNKEWRQLTPESSHGVFLNKVCGI